MTSYNRNHTFTKDRDPGNRSFGKVWFRVHEAQFSLESVVSRVTLFLHLLVSCTRNMRLWCVCYTIYWMPFCIVFGVCASLKLSILHILLLGRLTGGHDAFRFGEWVGRKREISWIDNVSCSPCSPSSFSLPLGLCTLHKRSESPYLNSEGLPSV